MNKVQTPRRVQRKRTKGFKLPPNTKCVTRPHKFGNPFRDAHTFGEALRILSQRFNPIPGWMTMESAEKIQKIITDIDELRGFNLACFCPLDKPFHADHLLAFANDIKQFSKNNLTAEEVDELLRHCHQLCNSQFSSDEYNAAHDCIGELVELNASRDKPETLQGANSK